MNDLQTDKHLDAALARMEEIFHAAPGTPEDDELGVLLDSVKLYEKRHHPIPPPDPVSAIEFQMDQANLTPRDLAPFIGSSQKVEEILSRKRTITRSMARTFQKHFGIPSSTLLPGQP